MHPQKGFGRQKTYRVTILQDSALTFLLCFSLSATGTRYNGSGIYRGDEALIQNNIIVGNIDYGGLIYCHGEIRNNLIAGNSSAIGGGLDMCHGIVQNNTITGNSAYRGGAFYCCGGTIQNNIIWGNTATEGAQLYQSSQPTYSCIQDWTDGGDGNIVLNPKFVDPDGADDKPETYEDNNYRLLADSPCIDAGKNEDWMWSAVDLDGNPRIFYGRSSLRVDMGAYEYGSWPFKVLEVSGMASGGPCLNWKSRVGDTYRVWSCADLSAGGWVEEASVASQGASTSWTDVSTVGQQKFYRIEMK